MAIPIETVTSLDELKALGYFETIRTVYYTKYLMLFHHTDGKRLFIDVPDEIKKVFEGKDDFELYLKALARGNEELLRNFREDIVISLVINSWVVFELIIKDLTKKDYSLSKDDISVDYKRGTFGLTTREKKNLDLFYYIRNAFVHYNGAYYAYREIDHAFGGHRFESKGNEGVPIFMPGPTAFKIHQEIERLAYKAWDNSHKAKK